MFFIMWFDEAVVYQIYPLGMCGAPAGNADFTDEGLRWQQDQREQHRILRVLDWIDHIKKLGATCVMFNPVFDSDAHGYDTRDYRTIDPRLGTNDDFKKVCDALHEAGLKVMLDGVLNHVGRGFSKFRDVQEKKWDSPYKDWFNISFDGNTAYNDGFWYDAWEGCYELVKLNLQNTEVRNYLFDSIRSWVAEYGIDGLRLDVAYLLDRNFLRGLRNFANELKPDFVLMGETLHGDYNIWMNDEACNSVTNYECYKGLYSSFNSSNMHEISYSLNRQFGNENWCLYTGKHLMSFLDNHDVTRIATILTDKNQLKAAYGMLFGMPGVPCVYYGSEWGVEGDKAQGDPALRPDIEKPQWNDLTEWISKLANARNSSSALQYGNYNNLCVQPKQLIFQREAAGERVIVAINADGNTYHADFNANAGRAIDLITGEPHDFGGGSDLAPYSCYFWKVE
jgi:glycosidase